MTRATTTLLAIAVGFSGAVLSLLPATDVLEEKVGLDLLFRLRGQRVPPSEVVVASIDRTSSLTLSAPDQPDRWPRQIHAALIRRLAQSEAALIGFNVFFSASQPSGDEAMAQAMQQAGSVVLTSYLKPRELPDDIYVESIVEPVPALADGALASAPFLLPQSSVVNRFWCWWSDDAANATLPVVLFQLYALSTAFDELVAVFQQTDRDLAAFAEGYRGVLSRRGELEAFRIELVRRLRADPELLANLYRQSVARALSEKRAALLRSFFGVLRGGNVRYLAHYGPSGTLTTIPYHRLAATSDEGAVSLRGKLVLVGFSEDFQPESTEGRFGSPFSTVSSVELAATAIANLLEDRTVTPLLSPSQQSLFVLFWGGVLGLLSGLGRMRLGLLSITLMSGGYVVLAHRLFATGGVWLPMVVPLFWQSPLALLGCMLAKYARRSGEHRRMASVMQRFIPVEVMSQLVRPQVSSDPNKNSGRLAFGVCLATDAGRYTGLAECKEPMALAELLNDYYATVMPVVVRNGGWVSDVIGDAMMAVWTGARDDASFCGKALAAALELRDAVGHFEQSHGIDFPIRIGLHGGDMRIGFVGTEDHGEFRAVGDTVNTAARMEALNKLLGTGILVSEVLIAESNGILSRPLGRFLLAGKSHPVPVHELLGCKGMSLPPPPELLSAFAEGLAWFQAGAWQESVFVFAELIKRFPEDGPTRFYLTTARSYLRSPPLLAELVAIPTEKPLPARPAFK